MNKNKKKYIKPEVRKNEPLVNITFSTGTSAPGTGGVAGPAMALAS